MSEPTRLSKIMSARGICSRREADELIKQGLVKVNGNIVDELGFKCLPDSEIELLSKANFQLKSKISVILYKPIGYISGPKEEMYPSALDLIQDENKLDSSKGPKITIKTKLGVAPAGRLDVDSTGLLILTANGQLAKKIIQSDTSIDKDYRIKVEGDVSEPILKRLRHGIELDGKPLKPAKVELISRNPDTLKFVLKEGRKRQIRRMCEDVGLRVTALRRERVGPLTLKGLKVGQWRFITDEELQAVYNYQS